MPQRSMPHRFTIEADYDGSRLDRFLIGALGFSSGLANKALRKGWIRVDGKRAQAATRLQRGQEVRLTRPGLTAEPPQKSARPAPHLPSGPLEDLRARGLIAREASFIVASKPSGLPVHLGTGHDYGWLDFIAALTSEPALAPIGRLDRDASGLMLLACGRAEARRLDEALRAGEVKKRYHALVYKCPRDQTIRLRLEPKSGERGEQKTSVGEGLEAVTHIRVLERREEACLVEAEIETGRTHQIRAHLAAIGHPILGDPRYAHDGSRELARQMGLRRLCLHAARLAFPGPDGRTRSFESPADFTRP